MDDRDRIHRPAPWIPWAITSVALVLVAIVAYSVGAHREAAAAGEPVRRAWFFFPGFWLVFVLFWMFFGGLRRMWWGPSYPYGPWGYRRYRGHPYDDEHDEWEEWHRRAHDRLEGPSTRGAPPSPSSGTDRGPTA